MTRRPLRRNRHPLLQRRPAGMSRFLTAPVRMVWLPTAALLRLLGFGIGVKPHSWEPPAGAAGHPLWQTVRERRGEPPANARLELLRAYSEPTPDEDRPENGLAGPVESFPPSLRPYLRTTPALPHAGRLARAPRLPFAVSFDLLRFGTRRRRPPADPSHPLRQSVRALRERPAAAGRPASGEAATSLRPRRRCPSRLVGLSLTAVVVVVALVVAVGSRAYFTNGGSGSGTVTVGSTAALTFSPGMVPSSSFLYPGGSGEVVLTVQNPNDFGVKIPSLVQDTAAGTDGFGASGCTLEQAHLTFTATTGTLNNDGSGWTVPANASAYEIDLADAVSMGTDADNACQNASFTVYLKVGP
jgi:hypothetical protein